MLARKAHNHFWRTESTAAVVRNIPPPFIPAQRHKINPAGKKRAVSPRPVRVPGAPWPGVGPGRAAGALHTELLAFNTDSARMALFASKRFAKTRACHHNFPHLKGNKRTFLEGLPVEEKTNLGYTHFPSHRPLFSCIIFRPWENISGALEMFAEKIVFSEACSFLEKRVTRPPLIQNFGGEIRSTFYISSLFFPPTTFLQHPDFTTRLLHGNILESRG